MSNASGFSDPGSSSTLVIPSATAAVSSSNTVTNAGNSSFAVSAPSSSAPAGSSSSSSSAAADAFINFGTGPYPEASTLTSGGAEAWYLSPTVEHVFGGVPNAQQQSDFTSQVLKDVQQTFSLSGLSPILTTDPTVSANHTISVVANTSYSPNPNAIGITDVGNNGFSFIDNLNSAQSVTDLEWAVAHNIAHELMHAFGVAVHHDQTGTYLDAATASWSLLTDPNTVFSPAAVQDILSHNYGRSSSSGALGAEQIDGDQTVTAQPVPEPSTLALWGMLGVGARVARRRRRLVA
ncbi:MAG: PEP-CTERM sorting domain-containing protein [Isosphaeraceae bacterium]|nr:PEP-CTERM sorting domain-containing protein [Isosphaeraceae bacterium]